VLSNTSWPRSRHEQIFARDGVLDLIDAAVYSSEIPYAKPHPEAFRAAMDAVDVDDPAEAVYVGDRLFDDIFGAQRVGMRAVYVPHSDIPEWQVGTELGEPDAVIHELSEVLDVIDAWS
jgi:putative hydrolase of the HAD superfamily